MAVMTAMPHGVAEWTVEDLKGLPDDGLRYELCDGILLVSPAPVLRHQLAVANLHLLLRSARPEPLTVLFAPVDWQPDHRTSFQPDVLVARPQPEDAANITEPLLLAVEVLSPSTRRIDALLKRSKYEEGKVASYWLVDPAEPSITAFELHDGRYETVAEARGEERVRLELPFPVDFSPAELLRP